MAIAFNHTHISHKVLKHRINCRYKINNSDPKNAKENTTKVQNLSKSTDWTEVSLEVPEKSATIHLPNPRLSQIFDNEKTVPTPPPRLHKKGFREKIEAVAKNSLQAFQPKKPVEEPLCVKKIVKPTVPNDDHDCSNRRHGHKKAELNEEQERERLKKLEEDVKLTNNKDVKRKKNLSVVSLPNFTDLKLTVSVDDKKPPEPANTSIVSLTSDKKLNSSGKLETCMTRCRSIGSLLPQQLLDKLRTRPIPTDAESDDSFGGLEDWDLGIIEHYNPKDASLPRPRKLPKTNKNTLSNIEDLIVKDEDIETPKAPARRSESLIRKISREGSEAAALRRSLEVLNDANSRPLSITPPPSPEDKSQEPKTTPIQTDQLPTEENGVVEHSSLMKILEEFSVRDKQNKPEEVGKPGETPPRIQFRKQLASIEDFINNEKDNTNKPNAKFGVVVKT